MRPEEAPQVRLGLWHHWRVVAPFSLAQALRPLFALHNRAVVALSLVIPDLGEGSREVFIINYLFLSNGEKLCVEYSTHGMLNKLIKHIVLFVLLLGNIQDTYNIIPKNILICCGE